MMPDNSLHLKLGDMSTSDSPSKLKLRQWNYIVVNVIENKLIQVYHNSKLSIEQFVVDSALPFQGHGSFYFGGDPWHSASYTAFLDELKLSTGSFSSKSLVKV